VDADESAGLGMGKSFAVGVLKIRPRGSEKLKRPRWVETQPGRHHNPRFFFGTLSRETVHKGKN
jgi:hypothetical protein